MKEIVIIIGTVILGGIIFGMIAGDDESLKTAGADAMEKAIEIYGS